MTDSISYPCKNGKRICLLSLSQAEVGHHVTIPSKSRSSTGLQLVLKQLVSSLKGHEGVSWRSVSGLVEVLKQSG